MTLTQPVVGSVGWGAAVNLNFQTLEDFCNNVASALLNAVPVMGGDSGSGGTKGLVPAPGAGDAGKFLRGDAGWAVPVPDFLVLGRISVNLGMGGHSTGNAPDGASMGLACYEVPASGQTLPLWCVVTPGSPPTYDVGNGDGADTTSTVRVVFW